MPEVPIYSPLSAPILALVDEARNGRLALCAGAGLSRGPDGLPDGQILARRIHEHFEGLLGGYCCSRPDHLPSVASSVASLPGGLDLLQRCVVVIAPFDSVPPTQGHRLLALLVVEGAVHLLTTNWDDCVERGWTEERIMAARDAAEAADLLRAHVLKIHGCCSRPSTILITETQLADPPLWTRGWFQANLATMTMVFVGVGDVAAYVRDPISALAAYVDGARIRVVSRSIVEGWDQSQWKDVLPDLSTDRRIAMSADAFADELARGWLSLLVRPLIATTEPAHVQESGFAFGSLTAFEGLAWLRRAAVGWSVGASVVNSPEAKAALTAVGVLARRQFGDTGQNRLPIAFRERAAVDLGGQRIEVLLARPNQPTSELERAVRRRAESTSIALGTERVVVLCSAVMPVGPRRTVIDQDDVFAGSAEPDDLIAGPAQVPVEILWADKLLEAA